MSQYCKLHKAKNKNQKTNNQGTEKTAHVKGLQNTYSYSNFLLTF